MKRLLLSAVLACALHALLLGMKVDWTKGNPLYQNTPLRIALSYKAPEARETLRPPSIDPPDKAPGPPAQEPSIQPKKKLPKKAQEQKTVSEPPATAGVLEAKPLADEKVDAASFTDALAPSPPASIEPTTSGIPSSFPPLQRPMLPPAPSRQAVPFYLKNPPPEYPAAARRRGYEGTVMIEVLVDREGGVKDLRLFSSSGYDMLDRAAMRAVRGWVFEPATQGQEKVEMWVRVPLTFRLKQ